MIAPDRLDQLRRLAVARVVGATGVDDADHWTIQCRIRVARAFDEGLAQEQRETAVALMGQALAQAGGVVGRWGGGLVGQGVYSMTERSVINGKFSGDPGATFWTRVVGW
jgi:hypothetical protein